MSLDQIHPVLITRDAAATIGKTLSSLAAFPEVVVYDNGSRDATLEICARFPNVRVERGSFTGFGPTKNHAVSLAAGDWILSIDADEYLGRDLVAALAAADLDDARVAYSLERKNLLLGKHVRRGGWGNNWLVRLFNRRLCRFTDAEVHEKVAVPDDARVERLDGALWHQAVTDIDQFLVKISRYSELEKDRKKKIHSPLVTLVRAGWAFFRSYVLQAGFLEGWRGVVIASCDGIGSFFKHMKRYVHRTEPPGDIELPD